MLALSRLLHFPFTQRKRASVNGFCPFFFFLSLSYSSYSVCIYNIYNITVCNNYILFVRLWANSFRATDEHKLRALYFHFISVLLMSLVCVIHIVHVYMCVFCTCMYTSCVCVCVCCIRICPDAVTSDVRFSRAKCQRRFVVVRAKRWSQVGENVQFGLRCVRLSHTRGKGISVRI